MTDLEREGAIESARKAMMLAPDAALARARFATMQELIAGRSPEQVARMEAERGLRS